MTALAQVFSYGTNQIRTLLRGGEPWFVGRDVCAALGYGGGSRNAMARLPERMKGVAPVNTPGGLQELAIVNEAGVYRLVMRSTLPTAEAFQDWLAEEVVPSIRKTGQYKAAVPAVPGTFADALQLAADQAREIERQQAQLAIAAPKAEAWDTLASADGDFSVADAAKILSRDPNIELGQTRLFTTLYQRGWLYRARADGRWRVYQQHIDAGHMSELPVSHLHPKTGERVMDPPQVRVTAKGLAELHRHLGGGQPLRFDP